VGLTTLIVEGTVNVTRRMVPTTVVTAVAVVFVGLVPPDFVIQTLTLAAAIVLPESSIR